MNPSPSIRYAVDMLRYNAWANQTLLKRIGELPSSVMQAELNTSFPTIARGFSHMYAVERVWYDILSGSEMPDALATSMPFEPHMQNYSVEQFAEAFAENARLYEEWITAQEDLERTVLLDNPYLFKREVRVSDMVLQHVNHGTYHRGNISAMLRQLGHASTMTDYILYWYANPLQTELKA